MMPTSFSQSSTNVTPDGQERKRLRADDWEPHEVSFVSIPFDAGTDVRGEEGSLTTRTVPVEGLEDMPDEPTGGTTATQKDQLEAERKRAADIVALAKKHGCEERAGQWIEKGATLDEVRAAILDTPKPAETSPRC